MRDYIFHGKRVDADEWVEGYLVKLGKESFSDPERYGICNKAIPIGGSGVCYNLRIDEVIPETVGQYTGLTDKNGRKIFEGDIVKTQPFSDRPYSQKAKYKQHVGVVKYKIRHFRNDLYEQDYEAHWMVEIKDYGRYGCCSWSDFFECEVIGTEFENKDLLESEVE